MEIHCNKWYHKLHFFGFYPMMLGIHILSMHAFISIIFVTKVFLGKMPTFSSFHRAV